jgi:hypothetical protein
MLVVVEVVLERALLMEEVLNYSKDELVYIRLLGTTVQSILQNA